MKAHQISLQTDFFLVVAWYLYLSAAPFPKCLFMSCSFLLWISLWTSWVCSWTGDVFKAHTGSRPAWGKRMGGFPLEKSCCYNGQKRESAKRTSGPSDQRKARGSSLCLRCGFGCVSVDISWAQEYGVNWARLCAFLLQLLNSKTKGRAHQATFKELSLTAADGRDQDLLFSWTSFPAVV